MSTFILDDIRVMEKLDSKNMHGSIALLSEQMREVWQAGKRMSWRPSKKIKNVLVVGMGGSTLGTHVIQSLYRSVLRVPVLIANDYHIPQFVDTETLVIVSSYSGSTEEPVAASKEALKKKAQVVMICSGGEMAKLAQSKKIPALIFPVTANPCGSPRMGLGYSIVGQMLLCARAGLITVTERDIRAMCVTADGMEKKFSLSIPTIDNPAKQLAKSMVNRTVWFVGAEHIAGNAHIAANQTNENGKRFAGYFLIPELNHHLMEGLPLPKENKKQLLFVLFDSHLYDARIQKRFAITKTVLAQHSIGFVTYVPQSKTRLEQVIETLVFSSYASFYSALAVKIDPTAIPMVDFFKAQLKK